MASRLFNVMNTSFESFDQTVKTYLSKSFENLGIQYTNSQIFAVIFNGIKGVMQNAMFYIEDALTEQNVDLAIRKKSVYSLAKLSGFEPSYGASATGTILAKTKINNGLKSKATKVYFDNHAPIYNKTTGITYSLILNTNKYVFDVTEPLIVHEFKIVQGQFKEYQYACSGEAMEKVSIDATGLYDKDYFEVYVNGELWEPVASLYDMYHDSKTYVLKPGYENIIDVMFGNGVYGRIPEAGASVRIVYLSHSGTLGNIGINEKTKLAFLNDGYDSFGNAVNLNDYITLSIPNVISGGTNSDSIDFVREMIGFNSRSNVLASEDNFNLFFKRFSFVGYTKCWSDTNSMIINATCLSNVLETIKEYDEYYKLTPNDMLLSDNHKAMIMNTLENSRKTWAGLTLKFQDPIIRRFSIICYVKSKNVYSRNVVKQDIKNAFAEYFMRLSNDVSFIPKSDLVTIALECNDEIESFDIDIISEMAEQAYRDGYYYKYEVKFVNGTYKYVPVKVYYEPGTNPGLDVYGNISLDSKLEIPMLNGGFMYYVNKDENDKSNVLSNIDAVQFVFI